MNETLDIKDFSLGSDVTDSDRILLAKADGNYFAGAITVEDFKDNFLKDEFAAKGVLFLKIDAESDSVFYIDVNETLYAKLILDGNASIFSITLENYVNGNTGKILIFLTGNKKISLTNINATIDLPKNNGTILLIDYYCTDNIVYGTGTIIVGDISIIAPDTITDFISTYHDNLICQIQWTSPKSNILESQIVDAYDIRYSNSEINPDITSIWNSLKKIKNIPVPQVPGTLLLFTITDLKANLEYYIYIKSLKLVNSIPYYSSASQPIYFKTSNIASTSNLSFMLNLDRESINARKKTDKFDENGNARDVDCIIDEKENNKFLSNSTPDLTNKDYETYWEIYKYSRDGMYYNIIIDLYHPYLIDKLYILTKDKSNEGFSVYTMLDYGYSWVLLKELSGVYLNSWYVVDLEFTKTRFIKILFDLLVLGNNGVDGFSDPYYNGSICSISNMLIYGASTTGIPDLIKPVKRRLIQTKSFDLFLCMNGHFYQDGRIHSLVSGEKVRLFGAGGHFCAFDNNNNLLTFNTISDLRFRMNRIPWVSGNNGTGLYFLDHLINSYKKYNLKPYITFSSVLDWCKYGGSVISRPVDNYWYPGAWKPVPKAEVRGADDMLEVTTNPLNYRTYAKCAYTFAAKYGKNSIDNVSDFIWNSPDYPVSEPMETGLDLLSGLEMNNEPDLSWNGLIGYTLPIENAALLSAQYDGNNMLLVDEIGNNKFGSKNIDLNFLVIAGGTAGTNLGWFLNELLHMRSIRNDAKIPTDVFSTHCYSSNSGDLGTTTTSITYAIPFEDALTRHSGKEIIRLIDFRDRFALDKEVWINEFGYGESGILGTGSKYQCFSQSGRYINGVLFPDRHRGDVKGSWIIRAAIEMQKQGIDLLNYYGTECESNFFDSGRWGAGAGVEMFEWLKLTDETPGAKVQLISQYECPYDRGGFSAMGIFGSFLSNGGYPITLSYWWISTFRNRLKDYIFIGTKNHEVSDKIIIACFKHVTEEKGAYVIYYNDAQNTGLTNITINVPENNERVTNIKVVIPDTINPMDVPVDLAYDLLRTNMPTSRHEIYKNGEWVLNNTPIYNNVYRSYTAAEALYPENPIENQEIVVLPTINENPYFPIVGPVGCKSSNKFNGTLMANLYLNEININGVITYEVKTNNRLAWGQIDAICDYLEYSQVGKEYSNGIQTQIGVVADTLTINISEFPEIYMFNGIPTTTYSSEISELNSTTINSNSINLYWNNNNPEDTAFDIFVSSLPESGYTLHSTIYVTGDINLTIISGLSENTTYYFKVRPRRDNDTGTLSDFIAAKTSSFLPSPTNLHKIDTATTTVTIGWDYTSEQLSDFVYFSILRATISGSFIEVAKINDKNTHSFLDKNLSIGTSYNYKIISIGTNGKSELSEVLTVTTKTLLEGSPVILSIITNKLGTEIILTFDLQLDSRYIPNVSEFNLTENNNSRLIYNVRADSSNLNRLILTINSTSLSEYTKNLPLLLSYTGASIRSIYGVVAEQFNDITIKNVIGNFVNLNATYKLNFTYDSVAKPDITTYWNNISVDATAALTTEIFSNIFDSYGMTTEVGVEIVYNTLNNIRFGYNTSNDGRCTINGIPSEVFSYGLNTLYLANASELRKSVVKLTNLNNSNKYTIKSFGSMVIFQPSTLRLLKMKINGEYSNTVDLTLHYDESGYIVLEDITPINGEIYVEFIVDIDASITNSTQYPKLTFMLIDEYTPSTEEDNKTVYIRDVSLVGHDDNITSNKNILLQLNLYGIGLLYRISNNLDNIVNEDWLTIPENSLILPYTIVNDFGDISIFVQVKNTNNESNIFKLDITYVDPYVPLLLKNVYINNNDNYTYNNIVTVLFEYDGTPTKYRIGTTDNLDSVEWIDYVDIINYTLEDVSGYYTLYCQLQDAIHNITSTIKYDIIQYIKIEYDVIELTVVSDAVINKDDTMLVFPKLKYDKELVFSYITDDSYSIYNAMFNLINKRYIDEELLSFWNPTDTRTFTYHLDFQYTYNNVVYDKSQGFTPSKFLEYTDGAGVKHRFTTSIAIWPDKFGTYDYVGGWAWPWVTAKEMRMFYDFGYTSVYHDIAGYSNTISLDAFDLIVNTSTLSFLALTGRSPKILAEPNGDHNYLTLGAKNSTINMLIAQSGDGKIKYAYPFLENFTLDKNDITVMRTFNTSDTYATDMLNELASIRNLSRIDRKWLIGSSHKPNIGADMLKSSNETEYKLFTQIENLYGVSGDDSIWFASVDEVYEYWFMIVNSTIASTQLSPNSVKYTLNIAKLNNFWFRSISCILTGFTENITITTSNNCNGLSYSKRQSDVLINIDFNSDLIQKVDKYMNILTNDITNPQAFDDALYFVQMLKPELKQEYQDQLNSITAAPILNAITINDGDISTLSSTVTVRFDSTSLNITHYIISEDTLFTDASWIEYNNPIQYTFNESSISESKVICVKLKNAYGESLMRLDSINYIAPDPISLSSISLANGATNYESLIVPVTFDISTGTPTHYRLAESTESLSSKIWIIWNEEITYAFTTTGEKTVYAQVKNETSESLVVSDTIIITQPEIVVVFGNIATESTISVASVLIPGVGYVNNVGANGTTYQKAVVDLSGNSFCEELGYGAASTDRTTFRTNYGITSEILVAMSNWNAPTLSSTEGIYPNSIIYDTTYKYVLMYGTLRADTTYLSVKYLKNVPIGTYTVKVLCCFGPPCNTSKFSNFKVRVLNQTQEVTDYTTVLNNNSNYLTFENVIVDSTGLLFIGLHPTVAPLSLSYGSIPPIVVIEIRKTA